MGNLDKITETTLGTAASTVGDAGEQAFGHGARAHFAFLKQAEDFTQVMLRAIPVPGGGCLVPVSGFQGNDRRLWDQLAQWWRSPAFAHPGPFAGTGGDVSGWIADQALARDDRVVFVLLDRQGHGIGLAGVALTQAPGGAIELGALTCGTTDAWPEPFAAAVAALGAWCHRTLFPECIEVAPGADGAIDGAFFAGLGFAADGDNGRRRLAPTHDPQTAPMILTAGPSISGLETAYVSDAVRGGWNQRWGEYIKRLENGFRDYLGIDHALSTSSCTGAMHIALAALGIGPGDEVLVPEITWVATASAVTYVGATPVFVDVEEDSWCMDPQAVRNAIGPRTRALMPVHIYGHPANMVELCAIAREQDLLVVEDAAAAIGAEVGGRPAGAFGDAAAFSFQGAKTVVAGEGGMLMIRDAGVQRRAALLWDHGKDTSRAKVWCDEIGFKYKISNLQAALALAQFERSKEFVRAKRRIFGWYRERLGEVAGLRLNAETTWARSAYWMSSIRIGPELPLGRDEMRAELKSLGIDTRPVFPAISRYPMWPSADSPVAAALGDQGINLPSGVCLTKADVDYVCDSIKHLLTRNRAS